MEGVMKPMKIHDETLISSKKSPNGAFCVYSSITIWSQHGAKSSILRIDFSQNVPLRSAAFLNIRQKHNGDRG